MPLTEWLRLQLAMLQLHILGLWPDVDPCLWGWCWPLWGGPQCYVWPVRSPMMLPVWPSPGSPPRHLSRFEWRSQITAPSLLWHPSHSPLFPLSCRPITFSPLLQNCFNFGAECWVTPFARRPPPWLQIYGSSHCQPIFTSLIIINVIIILDQTISEQPSDHHHCQSSKSWFVLASKGSTFKIHVSSIAPFIKEWPSSP